MGGRTERCRTPWLGRPQGEGIPSLVRLQAPSLTLGHLQKAQLTPTSPPTGSMARDGVREPQHDTQ